MTRGAAVSLAWALVAAVAMGDLWVSLRPPLEPVPAPVMQAAKEALESARSPGTLIVHSPLLGVAEVAALGDLAARPDLPPPAARARRRVLLLDRAEVSMGGFGRKGEVSPLGSGLVLRRFEPSGDGSGQVVVYDLTDALTPNTLTIERPAGKPVSRCRAARAEGGFACPGQAEWLHTAPRQLRIDGADQRCSWAHPSTGAAVVFTIPPPPPPPEGYVLQLRVRSALTDDAVRLTGDGSSVKTRVLQGGRRLGQVVRSNAVGWAEGKYLLGAEGSIRLEVTSVRDGRRHHCLDVQILEIQEEQG